MGVTLRRREFRQAYPWLISGDIHRGFTTDLPLSDDELRSLAEQINKVLEEDENLEVE